MSKVFVLHGYSGEYELDGDWVVGVFSTLKKAEERKAQCEEYAEWVASKIREIEDMPYDKNTLEERWCRLEVFRGDDRWDSVEEYEETGFMLNPYDYNMYPPSSYIYYKIYETELDPVVSFDNKKYAVSTSCDCCNEMIGFTYSQIDNVVNGRMEASYSSCPGCNTATGICFDSGSIKFIRPKMSDFSSIEVFPSAEEKIGEDKE